MLDPQVINLPEHLPPMAPARLWFLIESLIELQQRWRQAGSRLLVLEGDPVAVLPQLARTIAPMRWCGTGCGALCPRTGPSGGPTAAGRRSCGVVVDWDQLLVAPELLKTGGGDPHRVYGPFLRNWRGQVLEKQPATTPAPTALVDLDSDPMPAADPLAALRQSHGFEGTELCPCRPGEAAATDQLATFCDGALFGYEPDRNFPATVGTSYLSAALSVGTLSPRQAWSAAQEARAQARSDEQHQAIAVWEQELGWREFYQQALFHFPELADGPYREQGAFPLGEQ